MKHLGTSSSHYDGNARQWAGVTHDAPDVLLSRETPDEPQDVLMQQEVWKTLVRYVWHNAKSVTGACLYFGIAARHVEPSFERHMITAEVRALNSEDRHKWNRVAKLWRFAEPVSYLKGERLTGYTPLAALLCGEHGEWRTHEAMQARRRAALKTIFRAAWQSLPAPGKASGRWAKSLREAFQNFTTLAGEDRALLAWVSQTEFAAAFDETRAAMCARQKRKVKTVLVSNGCRAVTSPGGKSEQAIARYAGVQVGNRNRAEGGGRKAEGEDSEPDHEAAEAARVLRDEHEGVPMRRDLPRDPKALRSHLNALAERAEARRMAALCGVSADDICISKTKPTA